MSHFAHLRYLLDLEAAAEAERFRRASQNDAADGVALAKLTLFDTDYGLGGRLLLTFGFPNRRLPPNRLQPGSPVLVNAIVSHRRVPGYRGVVYERDWHRIGVAIEPPDDDLDPELLWRLDLAPDEISRQRQQQALTRVQNATGHPLAELRDVFIGARAPVRVSENLAGARAPIANLNDSQLAAVAFALDAPDVAIIHGPPGTGKTTTLVELIHQAAARGEKVLACAPSNAAVDNLLEKLILAGEEPVRLGHPARTTERLRGRVLDMLVLKHPDAKQGRQFVKDASALFRQADKWTKAKPQPGEKAALRREARALLKDARIFEDMAADRILDAATIVCGTLTGLSDNLLGKRQFDLVVIDEAAQATEPAAWLPILRANRVVLAGDHCQLPPTILSTEAAAKGLAISLMERFVALRPDTAKLLTVQYRMNNTIMAFSNAEFYEGRLLADATVADHTIAGLPPLRFIDTAGAGYDEEPDDTGSRSNAKEADRAVKAVLELLEHGVPPANIGVITPYRAQVRLLREKLGEHSEVEIDSVDGFQGREKDAIIITLVRSNSEGQIGFLGDTRRMNVAMTRARKCLMMIGDSATLACNPFFERLITFCEQTGALDSVWNEP